MRAVRSAIINGDNEKLLSLAGEKGLKNKNGWFGTKNKTWFDILFQDGKENIDAIFNTLAHYCGMRVEMILFEILNHNRIFTECIQAPLDYLINSSQYIENDLLFEPYVLLCLSGHIQQANRLREIYTPSNHMPCIDRNTLRLVKSREGLEMLINDIYSVMNFDDYSEFIYNLLYIVRPDFPESENCLQGLSARVTETEFAIILIK